MHIKMKLNNYDELKKVENFLFRFVYPEFFDLSIQIEDAGFEYVTEYNDDACGLVLITR